MWAPLSHHPETMPFSSNKIRTFYQFFLRLSSSLTYAIWSTENLNLNSQSSRVYYRHHKIKNRYFLVDISWWYLHGRETKFFGTARNIFTLLWLEITLQKYSVLQYGSDFKLCINLSDLHTKNPRFFKLLTLFQTFLIFCGQL